MLEILKDALIDSLKLLPVLVPMYIIIEIIEKRGLKYFVKPLSSKWSVLAATGVGVIPQCGFSVVATKLYAKKLIPLGALVAVFIVASDEAVPILITQPLKLLPLLGIKIIMAIAAGYFIIAMGRLKNKNKVINNKNAGVDARHYIKHSHIKHNLSDSGVINNSANKNENTTSTSSLDNTDKAKNAIGVNCSAKTVVSKTGARNLSAKADSQKIVTNIDINSNINFGKIDGFTKPESSPSTANNTDKADINETDNLIQERADFYSFGCHNHEIGECCDENHKRTFVRNYLFHPAIHVLTVFAFILLVNIIFGIIIYTLGEEQLNNFMRSTGAAQPLLAALIGLIPNCASSVAIAQMYSLGQLNLGAAVAGLSVNAGVSYVVLFKENKNRLNSLYIIAGLFAYSVASGVAIHFIGNML